MAELRHAKLDDWHAICDIAEKCFKRSHPIKKKSGIWKKFTAGTIVAVDVDKIVGFVNSYTRTYYHVIEWLAVDPDFERQGVGEGLLKAAIKDDFDTFIRVEKENADMVKLVKKLGFKWLKNHARFTHVRGSKI